MLNTNICGLCRICPDGRVERVITPKEVKTKDHAAQILG